MAVTRRKNLETGLKGLWKRKQRRDTLAEKRSKAKFEANVKASLAPEREDERLTRSTILASTALDTAVLPDPDRFVKAEASTARTAALAAQKREERRDALMELYINAADFILTEEELKKQVESVFAKDYWTQQGKGLPYSAENAFEAWGLQPTVKDMVSDMLRKNTSIVEFGSRPSQSMRTVRRQKVVAEELTGGKM
jgi:hypothetical protein